MAYVATRGGERAIEQAERLFRQDLGTIDAARVETIRLTMPYLIDRVMGEASLYDEELAALALAQTGGELSEAVLVLRAWRTTQPRLAIARPVQQHELLTQRRISAAFKDIPGGQILGPTLDYSHRVLATDVLEGRPFAPPAVDMAEQPAPARQPSLADWQRQQGLVAPTAASTVAPEDIPDLTREPLLFPASRAHRLQSLARAETGGVLALGAGHVALAVVAVMFSLVGAFYYLRVVKMAYFDEPEGEAEQVTGGILPQGLMSLNGLALIALGVLPGGLMALCVHAIQTSLGF